MFDSLMQRVAYERTFSLAARYERAKEKAARFVAWHLLPERVRMWTIVRRHADVTRDDQHPDTVSAFDLIKGMCKR